MKTVGIHRSTLPGQREVKRLARLIEKIAALTCSNRRLRAARRLMRTVGGDVQESDHPDYPRYINWEGETVEYFLNFHEDDYHGAALAMHKETFRRFDQIGSHPIARATIIA